MRTTTRLANMPLEWTGHQQHSAAPLQVSCLPLRGSVTISENASRAADMVEQVISNGQPEL
jgi:hypothetical protein